MPIYSLRSENLTGLGGHMGSERVWDNFVKYFPTIQHAQAYAELDYKSSGGREKIKWSHPKDPITQEEFDGLRTQDLSFVMYYIKEISVSDERKPLEDAWPRIGLYITWNLRCCVCHTHETISTDHVPCDTGFMPLPKDFHGWQTDGLGGWMCPFCYENWKK